MALLCARVALLLAGGLSTAAADRADTAAGTGATSPRQQVDAVRQLLQRRLPSYADKFELTVVQPPASAPLEQAFSVAAGTVAGTVALTGSSGVALASALNHYLKYDAGIQINVWFTSQALPVGDTKALPAPTRANITSPYIFQNYLNICAFGYSTAWYSWERWQSEVDWMALNGVVNPLAMVGQDAVWLDVFTEDFGLSKDMLLSEFFAGPTFQPWHWMGNLNGWGGPVDEAFIRQQQALQKNITSSMAAFGMKPVLPAFAGHVPKEMLTKFPDANITHLAPWHGHFPVGTYFLSPTSGDLFRSIGEKFLQRQAAALGVDDWQAPHYFLADAYNEMSPPVTDPEFLGNVSRLMYESMAAADSEALMVTQGWFLSAVPRMPWGVDQARAFLHGPPQGKLLVLDLNAIENPVWNRTESFYGVPFALCMLHNFGERPGLFGRLPELATAPPAALQNSVPGTMIGLGMTPEGINTNPVVYDLYAEMFWNGRTSPDLSQWVKSFYRRRYALKLSGEDSGEGGSCEAHAAAAWSLLQESVYSAPIMIGGEQGATGSDMAARPALNGGRIPDTVDRAFYNQSDVETAWVELLACATQLGDNTDGFAYDLVAVGRQVLSDRFNSDRAAFAQVAGRTNAAAGADAKWHCVHFNSSDDAHCKGRTGAKQIACQTSVCEAKGGNFSHDVDHNKDFPGCKTCYCCAGGSAPAPSPTDLAELKRLGAGLLELIDDMDQLLGSHHAFLLGTWLSDAEGWAQQASTTAHGTTLMEDARRVITLWGHPSAPDDHLNSELSQYSYRLWAGLVRSFYRSRWEAFITAVIEAAAAGKPFDAAAQAQVTKGLVSWEEAWVSNASNTAAAFGTSPEGSTVAVAAALCAKHVHGCLS